MTEPDGPDLVASLDQLQAGLGNVATMMGSYYVQLRGVGLPDELAFRLCEQLHQVAIGETDAGEGDL